MMNKEAADLKTFSMTVMCWLDAQDAANQQLRISIKKLVDVQLTPCSIKLPFNAERITWTAKVGNRGPFELSNNIENPDYLALLEFLKTHADGALASEGFYYWVFTDGVTIGRKPSNKVQRRALR